MWVAPKQVRSASCAGRQNGASLLKSFKAEDELVTGEELKLFQSVAVQFSILAMDWVDLLSIQEEELTSKNGLTTGKRSRCPPKNSPFHYQQSSNGRQIST